MFLCNFEEKTKTHLTCKYPTLILTFDLLQSLLDTALMHQQLVDVAEQKLDESTSKDAASQEHADDITLIVTDIEMPNMDGFELTKKIKGDPRYSALPVIALTTLAAEEDVAKGKQVGIDEYHIKLDKERLMACVHDYVKRYH